MQSILWFLVWFALLAGMSTPAVPIEGVSVPVEASMDEPFTLPYGSTATLDGGSLTITFEQIVEDSRCPADVMCFWSGQVIVALRVEAAGEEAQTVELGGVTDPKGALRPQNPQLKTTPSAEVGDYTVELLAVTPYPAHAATAPAEGEYTLSLVVR